MRYQPRILSTIWIMVSALLIEGSPPITSAASGDSQETKDSAAVGTEWEFESFRSLEVDF